MIQLLKVLGKRNKERLVPLLPEIQDHMKALLILEGNIPSAILTPPTEVLLLAVVL